MISQQGPLEGDIVQRPPTPRGFRKPIRKLFGHDDIINRIAWSPRGSQLASTSNDRLVKVWNLSERASAPGVLKGHLDWVSSVTWSPDGQMLATGSGDNTIRLWDVATQQTIRVLSGHARTVFDVAWSPRGNLLASASGDGNVVIWNMANYQPLRLLNEHLGAVYCLAWSPDGKTLATGSEDHLIRIWDATTGYLRHIWDGHAGPVYGLAWSNETHMLASASADQTVRLWGRYPMGALEGHTHVVNSVSFSDDDSFLATKSLDGTVRVWRCDTWDVVVIAEEPASRYWTSGLAFHPLRPALATLDTFDREIRVWRYDPLILQEVEPAQQTVRYTNAKVVLLGDSGVGKTALANALLGRAYSGTESTHGRHVQRYHSERLVIDEEKQIFELREIWLWDIAGQPDYRIVHQLHLNEVTLAVIVFDAKSEHDPLTSVYYFHRALQHTRQVMHLEDRMPLKKLLVAGRIDRNGAGVVQEKIDRLVQELQFDRYIPTSAKEYRGIDTIKQLIHDLIDWEHLPRVRSTALFQRIKNFLGRMRDEGKLLNHIDQLYDTYVFQQEVDEETPELRAQFITCIGLVEAQGLIKRFSFGGRVLLRPELLDAYASAMIIAAREETGGLGYLLEERAKTGDFRMPEDERIRDRTQEHLLLIATIEDLVLYEIVVRETNELGESILVFPSQATRLYPHDLLPPENAAAIWRFEGAILSVYTTLIVRLWHTGRFNSQDLYDGVAFLTTPEGNVFQLHLRNLSGGRAELLLFVDERSESGMRDYIQHYIENHLTRRAIPGTVMRRQIYMCPNCATRLTEQMLVERRKRGFDWISCPVCGERIQIGRGRQKVSARQSLIGHRMVSQMDQEADEKRNRTASRYTIEGKRATGDYDVYISYHVDNQTEVVDIAESLIERGVLPWLDVLEVDGDTDQTSRRDQHQAMTLCRSMAFFIGEKPINAAQRAELDRFVELDRTIILVILPSAPRDVKVPQPLRRGRIWVDFRKPGSKPLDGLIGGITGGNPRR